MYIPVILHVSQPTIAASSELPSEGTKLVLCDCCAYGGGDVLLLLFSRKLNSIWKTIWLLMNRSDCAVHYAPHIVQRNKFFFSLFVIMFLLTRFGEFLMQIV